MLFVVVDFLLCGPGKNWQNGKKTPLRSGGGVAGLGGTVLALKKHRRNKNVEEPRREKEEKVKEVDFFKQEEKRVKPSRGFKRRPV